MNNQKEDDKQKEEINTTLQNQIFSMLQGVIEEDDQTNEYSQDVIEKIFSTEGDDESNKDQETTNLIFVRPNISKPKTTQITNINLPQNMNYINEVDLRRQNHKRFQTTQVQNVPIPTFHQPPFLRSTPYQHLRYTHMYTNPYQNIQEQIATAFNNKKKFNTMIVSNPMLLYQSEAFLSQIELRLFQKKKIDLFLYQELQGKISAIIQIQKGARILLTYIENTPKEVLIYIYEEIKPKLSILLLDQYANRFCMKMYFELPQYTKMDYLTSISNILGELSINKISTYPIQCIVENITSVQEKELIVLSLSKSYMKLSLDVYGTHVLEKMILSFEYYLIKDLGAFVANNLFILATNANGLCIVKKILIKEYKQEQHAKLQNELVKHCLDLIQDPYGNYAIQIALDNWNFIYVEEIINSLIGNAVKCSNQKFSSNVIEKCFEKSPSFLSSYVNEICEDNKTFIKILKNNYGNYVLQTALKIAKKKELVTLLHSIESSIDLLSEKKRSNKWKRILTSYKDNSFNGNNNIVSFNMMEEFLNNSDIPIK